jgi:hypothetical protein
VEKVVGKAALAGKEVDHRNVKTSDNRMSNLRVVTPKQNNNGRASGPANMRRK